MDVSNHQKGSSYFVSGSEKDTSFVVSTNKRLYISNIGTRRDYNRAISKINGKF